MEGLWILVGIVGVIIVLIILDKIFNSGYEKELVETLDKEWGKENAENGWFMDSIRNSASNNSINYFR